MLDSFPFSVKAKLELRSAWTYSYCQHFQVLVYSSFNSEYGQLLGKYDGDMPLDQKFDIRMENGYVRGSYVTILDERDPPSLDVAEVQVYGSERRFSPNDMNDDNLWIFLSIVYMT